MSNNKQQTAVEWLIGQLQKTRDWQRVINEANQSTTSVRNVLQQAKEMDKAKIPIELPSDEEIKKMMELDGMEFDEFDPYDVSYLGGAIWMRNKIQGQ
jgi:hypothetical protein